MKQHCSGQALVEYTLILTAIAVLVTTALVLVGPQVGNAIKRVGLESEQTQPVANPSGTPIQQIANDFINRINAYYKQHGRWPRSWGDYRFTDLGLNAKDWEKLIEGVVWNPNGNKVGISSKSDEDHQIYVNDLRGNTLRLYHGWNIWCPVTSTTCYYHTVAPGNEVDLSTLYVKKK